MTQFACLARIAILAAINFRLACQPTKPLSTLDLREYGYRFADGAVVADYTEMAFLSEERLAVAINQRRLGESPILLDDDGPDSKVLVLDIKTNQVTNKTDMPIRKAIGSLHVLSGRRLAVLNSNGLLVCSQDLQRGQTLRGPGPLFVSPKGKRISFGGNGMTRRAVLDATTLREMTSFEDYSEFAEYGAGVIPGDVALMVSRGTTSFAVRQPGMTDRLIEFDRGGDFSQSRFVDDEKIVFLSHASNAAILANLDGKELRRYELEKVYRTGFVPTASGKRFGIYEHGYTRWNAFINFLAIEDTRPPNFQRVRIIDILTGNEIARFEWDPQCDPLRHVVTPQVSPNGRLLARVRHGFVELLPIN